MFVCIATQQVMMGLPGALPGAFMNPMIRPQCLIRPGLVVPHEGNPFMRHIITGPDSVNVIDS